MHVLPGSVPELATGPEVESRLSSTETFVYPPD